MQTRKTSDSSVSWVGDDGIHVMTPGSNNPTPEELDKLTKDYQNKIRKSPMWADMVRKFGEKKAEQLLKQCQVKMGS